MPADSSNPANRLIEMEQVASLGGGVSRIKRQHDKRCRDNRNQTIVVTFNHRIDKCFTD